MNQTAIERLQMAAQKFLFRSGNGITNYRNSQRREAWKNVEEWTQKIHIATTPLECVEIVQVAAALGSVEGDMAEAGVYMGGTAALILEAVPAKTMHLFDTFEGLPGSENQFSQGEWAGSVDQVRSNLSQWSNRLEFHRGLFPKSAAGLEEKRFSFVHLDLDLYQSTIDALNWFWPRMQINGAILSHDYWQSA